MIWVLNGWKADNGTTWVSLSYTRPNVKAWPTGVGGGQHRLFPA
jgi:hypothetical protein